MLVTRQDNNIGKMSSMISWLLTLTFSILKTWISKVTAEYHLNQNARAVGFHYMPYA